MKKRKLSAVEKFEALSDAQKEAEIAPFNRQDIGRGKPLTTAQRKRFESIRRQARRGRGRPTIGQGAKIVPVTIERELLARADAFARAHKLKRSTMVAQGLRLVMAAAS